MDVRGDDGGRVRFSAADEGVEALAWIVDVEPLLARLYDAVRFQPQVELLPQPCAAALTVVCEGRASATRDEFGVNFDVASYPQRAIAARLDCGKAARRRSLTRVRVRQRAGAAAPRRPAGELRWRWCGLCRNRVRTNSWR
jgi:2-polyprenyl-6-methoxyphenol hydroxylase-like FAD-dependent oxidoreductase